MLDLPRRNLSVVSCISAVVLCASLQGKEGGPGPSGLPGPKVCSSTRPKSSCSNFSVVYLFCFFFAAYEKYWSGNKVF